MNHKIQIIDVTLKLFVLAALMGAMVMVFTYVAPAAHRSVVEAKFRQDYARARLYQKRMYDFHGVCGEVAADSGIICTEDENGYRIVAQLGTNSYYCGDMHDFVGQVSKLPDNQHSCN